MRPGSAYLDHLLREVKRFPAEAIARRDALYRQFQASDFDLREPRALFDWSCRQCYIALANMMTAAAMIGIDSCPIEGFNQAGAERILAEAGHLEDGHFGLAVMVAFGYRINPAPAKIRQSLDQITRWV